MFIFQPQQLAAKLEQSTSTDFTGYWRMQFTLDPGDASRGTWYLAVVKGKAIYAGSQLLTWPSLLAVLKRHIPRLRVDWSETAIQVMEERIPLEQIQVLAETVQRMERLALLRPGEVSAALRLSLLTDLTVLFDKSGQARFIEDPYLQEIAPCEGYDLKTLFNEAASRRNLWNTLKEQVPCLSAIPVLNATAIERFRLKEEQKRVLFTMTEGKKTLDTLAYESGKDPLEIARIFANWIRLGIVNLQLPVTASTLKTIVVLDDSVVIQELIRRTLPQFQIITTGNPTEALSLIFRHKPDLVVLDATMPEANGLEICRAIRNGEQFKHIPIIMLTARDGFVVRIKGKIAGATDYLTKPFNSEALARTVYQYLDAQIQNFSFPSIQTVSQ